MCVPWLVCLDCILKFEANGRYLCRFCWALFEKKMTLERFEDVQDLYIMIHFVIHRFILFSNRYHMSEATITVSKALRPPTQAGDSYFKKCTHQPQKEDPSRFTWLNQQTTRKEKKNLR